MKQETIHDDARKMTQRLAKLNYRDTGFLSNATDEERKRIIALLMDYQQASWIRQIHSSAHTETETLFPQYKNTPLKNFIR